MVREEGDDGEGRGRRVMAEKGEGGDGGWRERYSL